MKVIPASKPVFASGETYIADRRQYDVYPADTFHIGGEQFIGLRGGKSSLDFDTFIHLKDLHDVTLDFVGATLVFHGKIEPFVLENCTNVTIKNVKTTYDRPPFSEFMILERTDGYVRLRANPNTPVRVEDEMIIPYGESWENRHMNLDGMFYQVFDPETRLGCGITLGTCGKEQIIDPPRPFHVEHYHADCDGEDIYLRGNIPECFVPGKLLEITHETRNLKTLFAIDCRDLHIENLRILCGIGVGIMLFRDENVYIDRFTLTYDELSPCLICNAADALHSFACSGEIVVENSVFEGMVDDAVNIHANFNTVDSVAGRDLIAFVASCEVEAGLAFNDGCRIAVCRGSTLEKKDEFTVEHIEKIDKKHYRFTLDREAQGLEQGDLIENLSGSANLTIRNCRIGKANSHVRLQTRGKIIIEKCEFELPLLLSGDASYWYESSPVTDLTVKHCRFTTDRAVVLLASETMPSDAAPYYHSGIRMLDNTFVSEVPVRGGYADNIVFEGNRHAAGKTMRLELTNCGTVTTDCAEVVRKTENKSSLKVN